MRTNTLQSSKETKPQRIVIVGGGVASLVAGIELRERLPAAEVELITAASPELLGGQVASWDENGYPIEHGLHALFGFYDQILPLLERIGALDNFTRSPKYVHVYERERIHRFRPRSWLASYTGFSLREKLELSRCLPALWRFVSEVKRGGRGALDPYDRYDLREFLGMQGVPESVLKSNFVRSLYDAPFNNPYRMSAAMGLQSLYRIFSRPWHYHFNLPACRALVEPLARHFVDTCGGKIRYNTRLERVCLDSRTGNVSSLDVRTRDGQRELVTGDEFVIALGIESFKKLDLGCLWDLPYFSKVRELEGVSSLSLQAWFREEPSPASLNTLLIGLPEPLSILSPTSRVRPTGATKLRLPHEIIATGSEGEFASTDDEKIAHDFVGTLRRLGFRVPDRWKLGEEGKDMYMILRRNRSAADRYLLTQPGNLTLRPEVQSPIPNLMIAGAWTRNSLALPCVNSAAESGRVAADLIMEGGRQASAASDTAVFRGMPRSHPLVRPPPYEYRRVRGAMFLARADEVTLAEALPEGLLPAVGFKRRLLLAVLENREVAGARDPSRSLYSYNEVVLAAVVTPRDRRRTSAVGLFPLVVYVDDDTALAVGREVYGFPKKMAQIEVGPDHVRMVRRGRLHNPGFECPVVPLDLLEMNWRERRDVPLRGAATRAVLRRLLEVGIFNELALPPPAGERSESPGIDRAPASPLTWVKPSGVRVEKIRWLGGARIRVGQSSTDPLWDILGDEPALSPGIGMDFGFNIGAGEVLAGAG